MAANRSARQAATVRATSKWHFPAMVALSTANLPGQAGMPRPADRGDPWLNGRDAVHGLRHGPQKIAPRSFCPSFKVVRYSCDPRGMGRVRFKGFQSLFDRAAAAMAASEAALEASAVLEIQPSLAVLRCERRSLCFANACCRVGDGGPRRPGLGKLNAMSSRKKVVVRHPTFKRASTPGELVWQSFL